MWSFSVSFVNSFWALKLLQNTDVLYRGSNYKPFYFPFANHRGKSAIFRVSNSEVPFISEKLWSSHLVFFYFTKRLKTTHNLCFHPDAVQIGQVSVTLSQSHCFTVMNAEAFWFLSTLFKLCDDAILILPWWSSSRRYRCHSYKIPPSKEA